MNFSFSSAVMPAGKFRSVCKTVSSAWLGPKLCCLGVHVLKLLPVRSHECIPGQFS